MQNLNHRTRLPFALALALLQLPVIALGQAAAPTITVADALRIQQKDVSRPRPKLERARATASLNAIYGASHDLRFDLTLNDQKAVGLRDGDTVKSQSASCRIAAYVEATRCIALAQGTGPDICPQKVCWTGQQPTTPSGLPAPGLDSQPPRPSAAPILIPVAGSGSSQPQPIVPAPHQLAPNPTGSGRAP